TPCPARLADCSQQSLADPGAAHTLVDRFRPILMRTCVRPTESPPTVRLAGDRDVLRRGPHGEGTPAAIRVHEPCLERGGGARRRAAPARPQRALARRNARGGSAPARGRVIADRGSESPRRLK